MHCTLMTESETLDVLLIKCASNSIARRVLYKSNKGRANLKLQAGRMKIFHARRQFKLFNRTALLRVTTISTSLTNDSRNN